MKFYDAPLGLERVKGPRCSICSHGSGFSDLGDVLTCSVCDAAAHPRCEELDEQDLHDRLGKPPFSSSNYICLKCRAVGKQIPCCWPTDSKPLGLKSVKQREASSMQCSFCLSENDDTSKLLPMKPLFDFGKPFGYQLAEQAKENPRWVHTSCARHLSVHGLVSGCKHSEMTAVASSDHQPIRARNPTIPYAPTHSPNDVVCYVVSSGIDPPDSKLEAPEKANCVLCDNKEVGDLQFALPCNECDKHLHLRCAQRNQGRLDFYPGSKDGSIPPQSLLYCPDCAKEIEVFSKIHVYKEESMKILESTLILKVNDSVTSQIPVDGTASSPKVKKHFLEDVDDDEDDDEDSASGTCCNESSSGMDIGASSKFSRDDQMQVSDLEAQSSGSISMEDPALRRPSAASVAQSKELSSVKIGKEHFPNDTVQMELDDDDPHDSAEAVEASKIADERKVFSYECRDAEDYDDTFWPEDNDSSSEDESEDKNSDEDFVPSDSESVGSHSSFQNTRRSKRIPAKAEHYDPSPSPRSRKQKTSKARTGDCADVMSVDPAEGRHSKAGANSVASLGTYEKAKKMSVPGNKFHDKKRACKRGKVQKPKSKQKHSLSAAKKQQRKKAKAKAAKRNSHPSEAIEMTHIPSSKSNAVRETVSKPNTLSTKGSLIKDVAQDKQPAILHASAPAKAKHTVEKKTDVAAMSTELLQRPIPRKQKSLPNQVTPQLSGVASQRKVIEVDAMKAPQLPSIAPKNRGPYRLTKELCRKAGQNAIIEE